VSYSVRIKPSARKELESLPDAFLRRVDHAIAALKEEGCDRSVAAT
jgi:mRNA-degrading endonuclease RelE of RelBE toxin-antitoxin system